MGWTMDKELEDTSKAAGSGFVAADRAKERAKTKEGMNTTPTTVAEANAATTDKGFYKRGGYVPARASGKRMYAKGGMVKCK